jgi:phage tail-like protein
VAGSDIAEAEDAEPTGQGLGDGAFAECSGLEVEMDIQDYLEGGRNDGVIQQVGRAKYTNIVLKRGMFYDREGRLNTDLWAWLQGIVAGRPVARYDGIVTVMKRDHSLLTTWVFERGLPAKIRGPELNAKTGQIAIEELHIAHEGLRLIGV